MTILQKLVAVCTLMLIALFLHMFLCDWDSGIMFTGNDNLIGSRARVIIAFGANSGIVGRSRDSIMLDGLLGIVLPILLVGSALFITVTPRYVRANSKPSQFV